MAHTLDAGDMVPSEYEDRLANILMSHDLYDDLYKPLHDNDIDLAMLENDLQPHEIDDFCLEFELSLKQKLKFRKLMRIIKSRKGQSIIELRQKEQKDKYRRASIIESNESMKLVIVGATAVGKTTLMRMYIGDSFGPYDSTIGFDSIQNVESLNDINMTVNVFDTAGQEHYQAAAMVWYKKADVMLVCYDASEKEPFESMPYWIQAIDEYAPDNVIVILVGCKNDIGHRNPEYQTNRLIAEKLINTANWKQFNAMHMECSAKTAQGVQMLFSTAVAAVMDQRDPELNQEKNIAVQNDYIRLHDIQRDVHEFQKSNVKKKKRCCKK
eukprot:529407_1